MLKNIIHITGNDSYGIELELKRWLGAFRAKYGDINIDRYDISDTSSLKGIGDTILMGGLFVEKRLFIFRGGRERKSKTLGIESILEEKKAVIPEDHFLLFHNIGEKEEGLVRWLDKNADTRKINTLWDESAWEKRSDLDKNTLGIILAEYKKNESHREKDDINKFLGHTIAHTIATIGLQETHGKKLDKKDIIELCHGYGGSSIFALVDAILDMNIPLSIETCHRITSSSSGSDGKWLGSLIGTLSNTLIIKYLKHHGLSENTIANTVRIHSYVLKKGYSSRISYEKIREFYEKIVSISIAYKRGKGLRDSELGRILGIELALLGLQKSKKH